MPQLTQSNKHRWHGVGNVDPSFHFTCETFPFSGDAMAETRYRPTSAAGAVWWVGGARRPEIFPLADIRQDGTYSSRHPMFSVAGHLVPKMMTGLDVPENLVPVTKSTNDRMQKVENAIKAIAQHPHYLLVEVAGYYDMPNGDSRVPTGFHYKLFAGGTAPGQGVAPIREWDVTQDLLQVADYGYSQQALVAADKLREEMKSTGWKIESCSAAGPDRKSLTFLAGALPPPDQRPLAFLDYWLLAKGGTLGDITVDDGFVNGYIRSIERGASFSNASVREMAIVANILLNDNRLISDAYANPSTVMNLGQAGVVRETHAALIAGSGDNAPQVDHVYPESLGGPNCFSNAQITSAQYNVQKGNATEVLQPRSAEWHREMSERIARGEGIQYQPGGFSKFVPR